MTLMVLGTVAPEIVLTTMEVVGNNFTAGEIGPSAIVGSAAFNYFVTAGLCIGAVPSPTVRRIVNTRAYYTTLMFSLLAYVWLYVIVDVLTPGVIDVWEAVATLAMFAVTVASVAGVDTLFDGEQSAGIEMDTVDAPVVIANAAEGGTAGDKLLNVVRMRMQMEQVNKARSTHKWRQAAHVAHTMRFIQNAGRRAPVRAQYDTKDTDVRRLWRDQLAQLFVRSKGEGGEDHADGRDAEEATKSPLAAIANAAIMPWRLLFALLPPKQCARGWPSFAAVICVLVLLTTIIIDLCAAFGCTVGLHDSLTALTLVAAGTCLADCFASIEEAVDDETADNSIGHVTVWDSVFLGIGIPWTIATAVHQFSGVQLNTWTRCYRHAIHGQPRRARLLRVHLHRCRTGRHGAYAAATATAAVRHGRVGRAARDEVRVDVRHVRAVHRLCDSLDAASILHHSGAFAFLVLIVLTIENSFVHPSKAY